MSVKAIELGCGAVALAALATGVAVALAGHGPAVPVAETVAVAASVIDFPRPGEFLAAGRPIAPPVEATAVGPFQIMKSQVGLADYQRCVAAGACTAPDAAATRADVPVTGVNWIDADAYARWYSRTTGEAWRLPTAEETAAFAAERFVGDPFAASAAGSDNPASGWISRYRGETASKPSGDALPRPIGSYGPNSLGLQDFGGNVWEWTSTCYARVTVDPDGGEVLGTIENCGVRVVEGRHRAYMSNFIRDGRSGGCAVGSPPENLGFRLVRDGRSGLGAMLRAVARTFGPTTG